MAYKEIYGNLEIFFNFCIGEICNKTNALHFYQMIQNCLNSHLKTNTISMCTLDEINKTSQLVQTKLKQTHKHTEIFKWIKKQLFEKYKVSEFNSDLGTTYNILFMDIYLLSCIYSNINKNIIIYAGQKHIDNIREFINITPTYHYDKIIKDGVPVPCVKINEKHNFFNFLKKLKLLFRFQIPEK
jgi:hypothetical protein